LLLLDTNIFLEILLEQGKAELCRDLIKEANENLYISDFSLHSVGVVLFRLKRPEVFLAFLDDMLPTLEVLRLSPDELRQVHVLSAATGLDFDDSLQMCIARAFHLTLVTLDADFNKLKHSSHPIAPVRIL